MRIVASLPRSGANRLSTVDEIAETSDAIQNRSFLRPEPASFRRGLVDAVRHAAERQRLQPDLARTGQAGEEDPFTAEERRLHLADELDVVVDAWLQRHQTAGVDAQRF